MLVLRLLSNKDIELRVFSSIVMLFFTVTLMQSLAAQDAQTAYTSALTELRSKLPEDARMISMPSIANWKVNGNAETSIVAADEISGGKAISIIVDKRRDNPWDVSVVMPVTEQISAGDTLFLAVQIRASAADNEAQSGVIASSKIEESSRPYTMIVDTAAQVGDKWTTLYSTGTATQDYAVGAAHITVHLAAARQTIEIGNAYAFNLGQNVDKASLPKLTISYPGREANAAWRAPAQKRIEEHRKGDIAIKVLDAKGTAIPGAKVHVEMLRHAFHFGSFVGHDITNDDANTAKLRETFPLMFNTATSPMYWQDWGWQSSAMRERYMASMRYLADQKIPWRGHPLIWLGEPYLPSKLKAAGDNPAAYKKLVLDHVKEAAKAAALNKPFTFDVINEPRDGKYSIDRLGVEGIAEAFRIAKAEAPETRLYVNDYGIISGGGRNMYNINFYHNFLDQLKKVDTPFSGIGMQGHFGAMLTDPARIYEVFEDFSRYNVPLQITEFDIDTTDEEAQADYTRDSLTIAFSHPSIEAFMVWGWWEGDHWRPNGAMLRKDWTPKPNYHAWRKLIFSDWWTNSKLVSDSAGTTKLRGFLGGYRATIEANGQTKVIEFSLPKQGTTIDINFN
jgi:endo-1,4-beta-xylanase